MTALDADAARLERVRANLARLGFAAQVVCGDAGEPAAWWDGKPYDRILADVPCTASGVARRHPDIKWLRRAADVEQFARAQRRMLDALWQIAAREMVNCCTQPVRCFTRKTTCRSSSFCRATRTPDA